MDMCSMQMFIGWWDIWYKWHICWDHTNTKSISRSCQQWTDMLAQNGMFDVDQRQSEG